MRHLFALVLVAAALRAQNPDLSITAQTLSRSTATAMFGRLPKGITTAAVEICNQTAQSITAPQARIIQQVKLPPGMTILPTGAAIALVAAKQGSGPWQTFARYGTAGLSVVSDLSALRVINTSAVGGAMIMSAATIFGVAIRDVAPATQTHQYMVLASSMMPDPLQLPALGCTPTFYALVESDPGAKTFDLGMNLPTGAPKQ